MDLHFFDRMGLSAKQRRLCYMACGGHHISPVILYGGAGGGGKSYGLRALAVYALLMFSALGYPGQRVVLACSTYRLLADRHIGKFLTEYKWLGAYVAESKEHGLHIGFKLAPHIGVVALRNLQDPDNYRGTECAGVLVDEATELPEKIMGEPVIGTLMYPIRQPEGFPFTFMVFGANPDGVGHLWVKNIFWTGSDLQGLEVERVLYIEAKHTENKHISKAWYKNLELLSEDTKNARLNADWSMPKGARFPMMDRKVHQFKFSERFPRGIPSHYRMILSVDYGLRAPYCALWHAICERGDIWTYREDYRSGLNDDAQARRILDLTTETETNFIVRCDPAMWAKKPAHDEQIQPAYIDAYEEILGGDDKNRFRLIEPGYNRSRGHALGTLHKLLDHTNGRPNWHMEESCVQLWSELCGATWDTSTEKGYTKEDIDERNPDHAITSSYYGLHWELEPAKEKSNRVIDLTRLIQAREALKQEQDDRHFDEQFGEVSSW